MLAWVLTYIIVLDNVPIVERYEYYPDMRTCFEARDELKATLTYDEQFPIGSQAVCIPHIIMDFK